MKGVVWELNKENFEQNSSGRMICTIFFVGFFLLSCHVYRTARVFCSGLLVGLSSGVSGGDRENSRGEKEEDGAFGVPPYPDW